MTRLLLITLTLFVLSSVPVYAKWLKIDEEHGVTLYTNHDTIQRHGNLARMMILHDYKTKYKMTLPSRDFSVMSKTMLSEFDCAEEQIRLLAFTYYSGNMANEAVV